MQLDKITVRTIQKFVTHLTDEKKLNSKDEEIGKLAPKTIKHHIAFISTVFDYAIKMQMLQNNLCKDVTLPKVTTKEREVYSLDEVQHMLELFEKESEANFKYVIFFTLAAFTGLRRGELLGLEWKAFDFEKCLMTVVRTSEWTKEKGIYTDTPKTQSSRCILKIPAELAIQLLRFKEWQENYKVKIGSKWIETDRLFTK